MPHLQELLWPPCVAAAAGGVLLLLRCHLQSWLHEQARLRELGSEYGALPAHEGLWESAAATAHSLPARLAVESCVHEARGLDVLPQTISRCIWSLNGSRGSQHASELTCAAQGTSQRRSGSGSLASSIQDLSEYEPPQCFDACLSLCRFRNGGDKATAQLLEDVIYPVSAAFSLHNFAIEMLQIHIAMLVAIHLCRDFTGRDIPLCGRHAVADLPLRPGKGE